MVVSAGKEFRRRTWWNRGIREAGVTQRGLGRLLQRGGSKLRQEGWEVACQQRPRGRKLQEAGEGEDGAWAAWQAALRRLELIFSALRGGVLMWLNVPLKHLTLADSERLDCGTCERKQNNLYLFIYLAVLGLSCGVWAQWLRHLGLVALGHVGS